jgi:hypothetical protein
LSKYLAQFSTNLSPTGGSHKLLAVEYMNPSTHPEQVKAVEVEDEVVYATQFGISGRHLTESVVRVYPDTHVPQVSAERDSSIHPSIAGVVRS